MRTFLVHTLETLFSVKCHYGAVILTWICSVYCSGNSDSVVVTTVSHNALHKPRSPQSQECVKSNKVVWVTVLSAVRPHTVLSVVI